MIVKLCAVVVCEAVLYSLLRATRPELAFILQIGAAVLLFFLIAQDLREIRTFFLNLIAGNQTTASYGGTLIKILLSALTAQFAADTARDCGQTALAKQVEFAGGVLIVILALPIFKAILQLLSAWLGGV